jgi:resorcinol 4-hydroxylase (FADH2)
VTNATEALSANGEWVERARALIPALRERADRTRRERQIPSETIADFHEAGLFRLLQPPRFGGAEGDYRVFTEVVAALAHGCGSSAWVYAVLTEHNWVLSMFPEAVQCEVWDRNPESVASSSFAPAGAAVAVPGGYRLNGEWHFSSGCDHAQWSLVGSPATESDGTKQARDFLVPRSEIEIVDDWFVAGLAGTGSKSLRLRDVFVPQARSLVKEDVRLAQVPGRRVHPDLPLVRSPRQLFATFTLVSVLVGLAQRAIDIFTERTAGRVSRGVSFADLDSTQVMLAEAAAEADAAALIVRDACERNVGLIAADREITVEHLARTRRDAVYSAKLAANAVERVARASGASAIALDDPMQRVFADANAVSAHRFLNWELGARPFGQLKLGRPAETSTL